MDINLERTDAYNTPAQLTGGTKFTLSQGDRLRMQVKPYGEEIDDILDEQVPVGKDWIVKIRITIVESE